MVVFRKAGVKEKIFMLPEYWELFDVASKIERDKVKAARWALNFLNSNVRTLRAYMRVFDDPDLAGRYYETYGVGRTLNIAQQGQWAKIGAEPGDVNYLRLVFLPHHLNGKRSKLKNIVNIIRTALSSNMRLKPTPQVRKSILYLADTFTDPRMLIGWSMVTKNINDIARYVKLFGANGYKQAYSLHKLGKIETPHIIK